MALLNAWKSSVVTDPTILAGADEHGQLDGKYAPGSWYYVACVVIVHVAVGIYSSHMLVRFIHSFVHVAVLRPVSSEICLLQLARR